MSIPFLGLGFSFFGRDKSALKTVRSTSKGFDDLKDSVDGVNAATKKINFSPMESALSSLKSIAKAVNESLRLDRLQTFVQALSLNSLQDIAKGIGDINAAGGQLTTSLEGTIVASHKTAKALGTNYGISGNALAKFSGQATSLGISLNVGADQAAKAIYEYGRASDLFRAIGIRNASDLAKLAEVTGMDVDKFTTSMLRLQSESGLTAAQLKNVVGSFTAFGKRTADVRKGLETLPQVMGVLTRNSALLQKGFKGISTEDFARQTAALGSAFFDMTKDADAASSMMTTLAEATITAREDFAGMFAGVKDDLPDFIRELGISTGDIGKSFDMMQEGPAGIVHGLAEMVVKAKKSGRDITPLLAFMSARLEGSLGKDQAAMITNFMAQANEATLETLRNAGKVSVDLGKLAREGFSTGRTLADQFELSQNKFVLGFRTIAKADAVKFVRDTTLEFNKFNKTLMEISKKGGPLGMMVDKMSEMHQIGVQALIPQTLRPFTTIMGTMVSEMTPALTALGAMGFRLRMLVNPLTLAAAAAGGIYFGLKKIKESGKTPEEVFKAVKKAASVYILKAQDILEEFSTLAIDFLGVIPWKKIPGEIGKYAGQVGVAVFDLADSALSYLEKIDPGKIAKTFINVMGAGIEQAVVMLGPLLVKISERLPALTERTARLLGTWIKQLIPELANQMKIATRWVAANLPEIAQQVAAFAGSIVAAIGRPLLEALKNWPEILDSIFTLVKAAVNLNYQIIISSFEGIRRYLVEEFPTAAKALNVTFGLLVTNIKAFQTAAIYFLNALKTTLTFTIEYMTGTFTGLYKVISGALGLIKDVFVATFNVIGGVLGAFKNFFVSIWEGIKLLITDPIEGIKRIILAPVNLIMDGWRAIGTFFSDLFGGITDFVRTTFDGITDIIMAPIDGIVAAWDSAIGTISSGFSGVADTIGSAWSAVSSLWDDEDEGPPIPMTIENLKKLEATLQNSDFFGAYFSEIVIRKRKMLEEDYAITKAYLTGVSGSAHGVLMSLADVGKKVVSIHNQDMDEFLKKNPAVAEVIASQKKLTGQLLGGNTAAIVKTQTQKLSSALDSIPAKSIIVTDKDLHRLAPTAQKTFGRMGQIMDTFGGKVSMHFEGAKSIGDLAEKSFDKVSKASTKWSKEFGTSIVSVFATIWMQVLELTDKAVKAIKTDTMESMRAVRSLASMSAGSSGVTIPTAIVAPQDAAVRDAQLRAYRNISNSIDEDILLATHNPNWYHNDYKIRFDQLIRLLASIFAMMPPGTTPAASNTSSSKTATDLSGFALNGYIKGSTTGVPR